MARIRVSSSRCSGCRLCEMACSYEKTRCFTPRSSGIWVEIDPRVGRDIPHVCQHNSRVCRGKGSTKPVCIEVCPRAEESSPPLWWDGESKVVRLAADSACVHCQRCLKACRLGAIRFDRSRSCLVKCDLCGGNPRCVEVCVTSALVFEGSGASAL